MEVTHSFCKTKISKNVNNPAFLLTNNKGGYMLFSGFPLSRYFGFVINKGSDFFKTINEIRVVGDYKTNEIKNNVVDVETKHNDIKGTFFFPKELNTFSFELDREVELEITFDCRKLFDNREFGRYYSMYEKEGKFILRYDKKNDPKEGAENGEYTLFVVFDAIDHQGLTALWQKEAYSFDLERRSPPYERYVYLLKPFKAKRIIATAGTDENEAINENKHVCKNIELLKIKQHGIHQKIEVDKILKKIKEDDTRSAYCNARNSMDSLISKIGDETNVLAGLPWFSQFWTRDALISLAGVNDDKLAKQIVMNYVKSIGRDGRLPNRIPSTITGCADGIGWLFVRVRQLIDKKMFDKDELKTIADALENSLKMIYDNYFVNGSIINHKQETWMDTIHSDDGRPGARIEIQALTLNMLKLCHKLTKNFKYKKMLDALEIKTFKKFWNKDHFKDGAEDDTVRPNIFIAYYAYPKMLSKGEWKNCFDHALNCLWMDWGGLSTLDKGHPLFQPLSTGENNASYHRGDSWYWINNISAICMIDLDKKKYKTHIDKILEASCADNLWMGIIGHSSELSSAIEQRPQGCYAQAWSAATLVELIEKLHSKAD